MRELWSFRELVLTLAERDLRVRYKQAALGIAWAVITPLAMMIAFTVIFTKVAQHQHPAPHGVPYALFSYLGLLPWTFFSTSLTTGGLSLVGNVPLLNKLYCPREVFPIAAMIDAAADALIATSCCSCCSRSTASRPKVTTLYVPLLLVVLLVFTLGVTLRGLGGGRVHARPAAGPAAGHPARPVRHAGDLPDLLADPQLARPGARLLRAQPAGAGDRRAAARDPVGPGARLGGAGRWRR